MRVTIKHSPTRRQLGVVSSIAAPLLAAAAVTVIAVIIQSQTPWPYLRRSHALTLATAALIISISSSIWAAYCDGEPHGETTTSVSAPDMNDKEYWKAVDAFQASVSSVGSDRLRLQLSPAPGFCYDPRNPIAAAA